MPSDNDSFATSIARNCSTTYFFQTRMHNYVNVVGILAFAFAIQFHILQRGAGSISITAGILQMPDRILDLDSLLSWFDKYTHKLNLVMGIAPNGVIRRKLHAHLQQIAQPINAHHLMLMHQWNPLTKEHEMLKPSVGKDGTAKPIEILHTKLRKTQEQEHLPGSYAASAEAHAAKGEGNIKSKPTKNKIPSSRSPQPASQSSKRGALCEAFSTSRLSYRTKMPSF